MTKAKMRPIDEAYARCEPMRRALNDMQAVRREVNEDKYGIVWERWLLPNGKNAVLWATPRAWDIFLPADNSNNTDAAIAAVTLAAAV